MENFVKGLDKEDQGSQYFCLKFPQINLVKLKEGKFIGPQKQLFNDIRFAEHLNSCEKGAWLAIKAIVRNLLGNKKLDEYKKIVKNIARKYNILGCNMSLKLHFLDSSGFLIRNPRHT